MRNHMLRLYHTNTLIITEIAEYSVYADGGIYGYLPVREAPEDIKVGDSVEAFIYIDAADEVVATMAVPYTEIGECAYLEVIDNGERGTFLDWGLPKDLLLPYSEQTRTVQTGDFVVVYVYQDERQRPVASMRLHRYLEEDYEDLKINEAVDLLIAGKSDLGYKAVINNEQLGLIYHEELTQPLIIGTRMKGWVSKIREDGKININVNKLDNETRDDLENEIMAKLKESAGCLHLSDKSSPDLIYARFKVSKKNFKRALGNLYKKRLINISPEFIELVTKDGQGNEDN